MSRSLSIAGEVSTRRPEWAMPLAVVQAVVQTVVLVAGLGLARNGAGSL